MFDTVLQIFTAEKSEVQRPEIYFRFFPKSLAKSTDQTPLIVRVRIRLGHEQGKTGMKGKVISRLACLEKRTLCRCFPQMDRCRRVVSYLEAFFCH